jgi:pyruvate/2-oxoglutarate/acetoin dehydrogenase E1 component
MSTTLKYRDALTEALREELARDQRVFLMGEDIGALGGAFQITAGLQQEFGAERVRDTPISESTVVGMGVGAALSGLRPVVELLTVNFALLAVDQIVNNAAALRSTSGGQLSVPLVLRMPQGVGAQLGPTHSHDFAALFGHIPGLVVAQPASAADAKGLLKTAIRDDNPVVFLEHSGLYGEKGEVPDGEHLVPFGVAAVRREGQDVTIVALSRMVRTALEAADVLEREFGISAAVIDPRTIRPLDLDTILASVRRTNQLVIVEQGWPQGGFGATLAALVQEQAFDHLDGPVLRVAGGDVATPYSRPLEHAAIPDAQAIVHAVRRATGRG